MHVRRSRRRFLTCCGIAAAMLAGATQALVPTALNDAYEVTAGDTLSVDAPGVLDNDTGSGLTAVLVEGPAAGGFLELFPDGSFEYTPPDTFADTDTFSYQASESGMLSNIATVTIDILGSLPRVAYTNQTSFVAHLESLGATVQHEGFESDTAWGAVRTTVPGGQFTAPSITNLGITWTANNPDGEVTTGQGAARTGDWGFFVLPHGNFATGTDCHLPVNCGDGWTGVSAPTLIGIGGWVRTNTPFAKVGLFVNGDTSNPVDFGETCDPNGENCSDNAIIGTGSEFFGIVDTAGISMFEYRELEGTIDDQKFIFLDDVHFASTGATDTDGDGVMDDADNCIEIANPDQRDTNSDGYGNICDPDLDDDGAVNFVDLNEIKNLFFSADADADLDGDGAVNFVDLNIMKMFFFGPPGPSGVAP